MAQNEQNKPDRESKPPVVKSDPDLRYFKTHIHGLKVMVGDPDVSKGEIAPQYVRFEPFWVQLKGRDGQVKMGYLATSDGTALKKLDADLNVQSIEKAEFEEATVRHLDESGEVYAGIRAPY